MNRDETSLLGIKKRWSKNQDQNMAYYLRCAFDLGRASIRRAKCYFCDGIKRCHVLDLTDVAGSPPVSRFVCPACEKKHLPKG